MPGALNVVFIFLDFFAGAAMLAMLLLLSLPSSFAFLFLEEDDDVDGGMEGF